jgi:murein DD-endopeptidase MepM/ murein hydrolase activator NlpD
MRNLLLTAMLVSSLVFTGEYVTAISPEEQRIHDLQARIAELQRQQDAIRGDLAVTQAQKQTLQREINSLLGQIKLVETQIATTEQKIDLTQTELGRVEESIAQKREEMSRRRESIGRMILYLEQRDHEPLVTSLFKHANLSGFFRQLDDLTAVQFRLLDVIDGLRQVKLVLEDEQVALQDKQEELEDLSEQAQQRRAQLAGVQSERNRVLKATQGKEATYQKQIADIEKQKSAFFKELRELELKIVSGGLYIVHITASTVPPPGTKLFSWPEQGYRLTQGYGMTAYAKRGAYGGAPHNGIDMAAGYGSPIMAIGDGLIVSNGFNSGWGNWIAIQHSNNMVSVYGHMSSLAPLKVGTTVTRGQVIGYEGNTGHATGSHVHLSLYREFFTYLKGDQLYFNYFDGSLNPANYL